MSTTALQRVYVRLLFDPGLVARVYENAAVALADVALTERERGWLLACDPRLFTADPLRRRRTLKGLLEEYRASSALAVAATRRLAVLDAFFSSRAFHDSIQNRGSMALAFGDYLAGLETDARVAPISRIERAIASARRGQVSARKVPPFDPTLSYRLAPHVALAQVPSDALAVMQAVEQVLFEISLAPVSALAEDGPNLASVPKIEGATVTLLAVRGEGEHVALEELPDGLATLLWAASTGLAGNLLLEKAEALGASLETLQGLLDDRVLVAA